MQSWKLVNKTQLVSGGWKQTELNEEKRNWKTLLKLTASRVADAGKSADEEIAFVHLTISLRIGETYLICVLFISWRHG